MVKPGSSTSPMGINHGSNDQQQDEDLDLDLWEEVTQALTETGRMNSQQNAWVYMRIRMMLTSLVHQKN